MDWMPSAEAIMSEFHAIDWVLLGAWGAVALTAVLVGVYDRVFSKRSK